MLKIHIDTKGYTEKPKEHISIITKRVKRSEGVSEPYTTVDTDTIKIEIIPSGLRVYDKAENKIFTIERKIK